jgi:hypothetical protein
MVRVWQTFETREQAEAFKANYLRSFHPCGYGTWLEVFELEDGRWVCKGSRFSSCD